MLRWPFIMLRAINCPGIQETHGFLSRNFLFFLVKTLLFQVQRNIFADKYATEKYAIKGVNLESFRESSRCQLGESTHCPEFEEKEERISFAKVGQTHSNHPWFILCTWYKCSVIRPARTLPKWWQADHSKVRVLGLSRETVLGVNI